MVRMVAWLPDTILNHSCANDVGLKSSQAPALTRTGTRYCLGQYVVRVGVVRLPDRPMLAIEG